MFSIFIRHAKHIKNIIKQEAIQNETRMERFCRRQVGE